jgi:sugar phosphate isomerase/epimerase
MRPAIWTSYLVEFSPEQAVVTFAEKEWRELELSDEHARMLLDRGRPAAVGAEFRQFAADYGVSFPQGHLWLTCDIASSNQSEVVSELKQWLDLFLAVGVEASVLHPGGQELLDQGCDADALFDARVRALSALTNHLAGTGMTICLENIPIANTAEELCHLVDGVSDMHLGICLDTGHLHMGNGDQAAFIRRAAPHLKALHIADNDGSSDQHLLPYGHGTIRWEDVVSALKDVGYSGLFNLEVSGERRCPIRARLAKLDYTSALLSFMLDPSGKLR